MIGLEGVRQLCIRFKKAEKIWKKKTPKGKKYVGYNFVPFTEKTELGFMSMGYRAKPVYRKKQEKKI